MADKYHSLFTSALVEGFLDSFYLLAIVHIIAVNVHV